MKLVRLRNLDEFKAYVTDDTTSLARTKSGELYIAVPGGRSVLPLAQGLLACKQAVQARLRLILVDERLEGESNLQTLIDAGLGVFPIIIPSTEADGDFPEFDRVYLGIGEDGHFASRFPGSWPEPGSALATIIEDSPKPPLRRVTLTYHAFEVLAADARINLLFFNEGKRNALDRFLANKEQPETLPCAFFSTRQFSVTVITDLKE